MQDQLLTTTIAETERPASSLGTSEAEELRTRQLSQFQLVWLRFRRVNQAEGYQELGMYREGGLYQVIISGEYTASHYPLQYFFRFAGAQGHAWLYPGFGPELTNQPYFVVRGAGDWRL